MHARKSIVATAVLASTLAALWAGGAAAGQCTICLPDPLTGKIHCFENMCAHIKTWLHFPPDAQVKTPIDITSIARELQTVVADPVPLPWVLVNPTTKRQFIVDLQKGTMTEIVAAK
ncbi:hypothetical protein HNQ60_005314 [Povalibacter uvarum]|uniref:Uncharacterized protein n=1 Tax=Povalibacter uvarum TaxID=732238 RepID=A0A841HWR6_9GAMM|nr:hypothetical protein [Povalibacter uvarum]MBB6096392.1 hypothetical protein [Povalibacter uvarum]